jgi:hypothetical protein
VKRRGRTVSNLDILSDLKQKKFRSKKQLGHSLSIVKSRVEVYDTVLFYQKALKQLRSTLVEVGANVLIVRLIKTDHIEDFIGSSILSKVPKGQG